MERLQKIIAASGLTSRRKAEEWITAGRVKVDGEVITTLGFQPSAGALIEVDGKPITKESKVYYLLNKPRNVLSSCSDDRQRPTVIDYIDCQERLYPVGRLDFDTTGLLILTNDGEFANLLTHPRFHLEKRYHVSMNGIFTPQQVKQMEQGVTLDDGTVTLSCKVRVTSKNLEKKTSTFDIAIKEGKNRQIKRMVEVFGYRVVKLNRYRIGCLEDKSLPCGQARRLKPFEVKQLKQLAETGKLIV